MRSARRWRVARVGPVDLGDERLKHGRPGRYLGHRDTGPVTGGDGGDGGSDAESDGVALHRTLVLGEQVDLDVRHAGALAQVVVPHQPVEAVGRRRPDVDLIVGDLLLLADGGGDLPRHLRGALERAVLGHVEDDLQLALVVEGQHLDPHPAGGNEGHRSEEEDARSRPGTTSARPIGRRAGT